MSAPRSHGPTKRKQRAATQDGDAVPRFHAVDMHCHLDKTANAAELARDAAISGLAIFATTVSPSDAIAARDAFRACPNVRAGVGLHPWQVADGTFTQEDIALAAALAGKSPYVGEIGLDFGTGRIGTASSQIMALEWMMQACAEHPLDNRVISLHAVQAADEVMDALERYSVISHAACIFHWFSGTADQLNRARKAGYFFSINERMLKSKRGREYARQIPRERLLLETDAPTEFGAPLSAADMQGMLDRVIDELARVRGENPEQLAETIALTSERLLDL